MKKVSTATPPIAPPMIAPREFVGLGVGVGVGGVGGGVVGPGVVMTMVVLIGGEVILISLVTSMALYSISS